MLVISTFFFFKQKTAYEMRISDWSSDVCSSDLRATWVFPVPELPSAMTFSRRSMYSQRASSRTRALLRLGMALKSRLSRLLTTGKRAALMRSEERRVGKEWSVRVDLGGRRIIKKKNDKI